MDVDVPADARLRRPTAAARRALCWAQIVLCMLVVLAAWAAGATVQERVDARAAPASDDPVVLVEAVIPSRIGDPAAARSEVVGAERQDDSETDGALAAIGTLIVGATLTASAGTVGRRWLDDHEAARWDAGWARVEPVWSGRVR